MNHPNIEYSYDNVETAIPYYNEYETELCKLGFKYRTDKCPKVKHTYTPYYYDLLNHMKESCKYILELGIGFDNYTPNAKKGGSLYMWRDFFPNSFVIGLDFDRTLLFKDDRIDTFFVDQRSENILNETKHLILETYPNIKIHNFDLIIDDCSHYLEDQIRTLLLYWDLVNLGGYYIIEDFFEDPNKLLSDIRILDIINNNKVYCYITNWGDNQIVSFKKC